MTASCFTPEAQVTLSHWRICATLMTGIGMGQGYRDFDVRKDVSGRDQ